MVICANGRKHALLLENKNWSVFLVDLLWNLLHVLFCSNCRFSRYQQVRGLKSEKEQIQPWLKVMNHPSLHIKHLCNSVFLLEAPCWRCFMRVVFYLKVVLSKRWVGSTWKRTWIIWQPVSRWMKMLVFVGEFENLMRSKLKRV